MFKNLCSLRQYLLVFNMALEQCYDRQRKQKCLVVGFRHINKCFGDHYTEIKIRITYIFIHFYFYHFFPFYFVFLACWTKNVLSARTYVRACTVLYGPVRAKMLQKSQSKARTCPYKKWSETQDVQGPSKSNPVCSCLSFL